MLGAVVEGAPPAVGPPQENEAERAGCALLSLLACQSSQAARAGEQNGHGIPPHLMGASAPLIQEMGNAAALAAHDPRMLGIDLAPIPPSLPPALQPHSSDPHEVVWIIERRGLHLTEPWSQLPRSIRPKAKLPGFLRAGWQLLEMIRQAGLQEYSWLVQDNHVVPSSRAPHTYIYTHEAGRAGRKRPLPPGGLTITTEGGGHFWTENGQSGAAPAGTEGVFACSARDAQGELLLGKCFRRARLKRHVSDRSVKKADVDYIDNYSLLHLGVRELTEQRAFVNQHHAAAEALGIPGLMGGAPPGYPHPAYGTGRPPVGGLGGYPLGPHLPPHLAPHPLIGGGAPGANAAAEALWAAHGHAGLVPQQHTSQLLAALQPQPPHHHHPHMVPSPYAPPPHGFPGTLHGFPGAPLPHHHAAHLGLPGGAPPPPGLLPLGLSPGVPPPPGSLYGVPPPTDATNGHHSALPGQPPPHHAAHAHLPAGAPVPGPEGGWAPAPAAQQLPAESAAPPSGFVGGEPKRPHTEWASQPFEELSNVENDAPNGHDGSQGTPSALNAHEVESVVENDAGLNGVEHDALSSVEQSIEHDAPQPGQGASYPAANVFLTDLQETITSLEAAVKELREQFPPPAPPPPVEHMDMAM